MGETVKKESSLTKRAFWLMFAKTLGFALTFILPPLLVRRLTQTEYGLFKQIFLVVGTAIAVLPLGFGMSAYYFLPREDERRRAQVVFNVLLFSATIGGLGCFALVLFPGLLGHVFQDATLVEYGPLTGVVIFFWVVSSFLETAAVANQETRLSTVFIICAQLTKTLFMLAALFAFGTLRALVYASLLQGVLQTAILLGYLRSRFPHFWRGFELEMLRTQLAYAMPLAFAGLLFTPAYLSSWPIFALNLTLLPFSIFVLDPVMRAYAEHRYFLLRVRALMLVVLVAGLWLGVARFGLLGAVGTVVLVSTLERLALIAKFGRVLGVSRRDAPLFKDVLKIAVAAATSAGAAALVRAFMPGDV